MRPFGVSRDSPWSHRAWKEALGVDVPLLSDWNGELLERFDTGRMRHGMTGVPARAAVLVDRDGTVRASWRYDDSEVPDFDELVAAAQASPA